MSEQVCAAKQELAAEFFAYDHGGTVTVSCHTIAFDIAGDAQVHVWWRISDADFISLAAYGLGDVITRLQEALGPFDGRLRQLQATTTGQLRVRRIA